MITSVVRGNYKQRNFRGADNSIFSSCHILSSHYLTASVCTRFFNCPVLWLTVARRMTSLHINHQLHHINSTAPGLSGPCPENCSGSAVLPGNLRFRLPNTRGIGIQIVALRCPLQRSAKSDFIATNRGGVWNLYFCIWNLKQTFTSLYQFDSVCACSIFSGRPRL